MEATEPGIRPQLVLAGFALLLVLLFVVACAAGRAVGPLTPGPHTVPGPVTGPQAPTMPGMPGMDAGGNG